MLGVLLIVVGVVIPLVSVWGSVGGEDSVAVSFFFCFRVDWNGGLFVAYLIFINQVLGIMGSFCSVMSFWLFAIVYDVTWWSCRACRYCLYFCSVSSIWELLVKTATKGPDKMHHNAQVSRELITQSRISRIVTTNRDLWNQAPILDYMLHMITVMGRLM